MRPSQDTTVYGLLRDGAQNWPDRLLVRLDDGEPWTWAQALREGVRAANALAARGVRRDDRVMMPLPNGPTWLQAWWGATLLGAVIVPVNPMLRGQTLADICDLVSPAALVAHDEMAALLPARHLERRVTPEELTTGADEIAELDPPPAPWDTHCLLMTSGTTGRRRPRSPPTPTPRRWWRSSSSAAGSALTTCSRPTCRGSTCPRSHRPSR